MNKYTLRFKINGLEDEFQESRKEFLWSIYIVDLYVSVTLLVMQIIYGSMIQDYKMVAICVGWILLKFILYFSTKRNNKKNVNIFYLLSMLMLCLGESMDIAHDNSNHEKEVYIALTTCYTVYQYFILMVNTDFLLASALYLMGIILKLYIVNATEFRSQSVALVIVYGLGFYILYIFSKLQREIFILNKNDKQLEKVISYIFDSPIAFFQYEEFNQSFNFLQSNEIAKQDIYDNQSMRLFLRQFVLMKSKIQKITLEQYLYRLIINKSKDLAQEQILQVQNSQNGIRYEIKLYQFDLIKYTFAIKFQIYQCDDKLKKSKQIQESYNQLKKLFIDSYHYQVRLYNKLNSMKNQPQKVQMMLFQYILRIQHWNFNKCIYLHYNLQKEVINFQKFTVNICTILQQFKINKDDKVQFYYQCLVEDQSKMQVLCVPKIPLIHIFFIVQQLFQKYGSEQLIIRATEKQYQRDIQFSFNLKRSAKLKSLKIKGSIYLKAALDQLNNQNPHSNIFKLSTVNDIVNILIELS